MDGFEKEVIQKIAILETKMDIVSRKIDEICDYNPTLSGKYLAKIGGIITGLSVVISYVIAAIGKGQ